MSVTADVLVIGAGVIGSSIAFELASAWARLDVARARTAAVTPRWSLAVVDVSSDRVRRWSCGELLTLLGPLTHRIDSVLDTSRWASRPRSPHPV